MHSVDEKLAESNVLVECSLLTGFWVLLVFSCFLMNSARCGNLMWKGKMVIRQFTFLVPSKNSGVIFFSFSELLTAV